MRRLTILLATVGALLLVSAAQAFANGAAHVEIEGTGSGEVRTFGALPYAPQIECSYETPGPATGTCETELPFEAEEEVYAVQLNPKAAPGSEFAGWILLEGEPFGGFPNCVQGGCTAYVPGENEDITIIAVFEDEPGEPLTLNIEEGEGSVVSNPAGLVCSGEAPHSCEHSSEGKVVLTASPANGYLFKSWKGCDSGGVNGRQCTVTVSGPGKTVGAKFVKAFSLEGSKSGGLGIMGTSPGGINCGYACSASTALYKEGALTVRAKPAKHFHFVEFTGGTGSTSSCNGVAELTCTIASFHSNSTIEEVYAEDEKNTLSLTKSGGGQGFVKTKPTNINCGLTCTAAEAEFFASETAVEVTVTLGKGTTSVTWTSGAGSCTGNATSCTVDMSSAHSLVAKFE